MSIRMRAKEQSGLVTVKALVKHPMETGQRKAKDGSLVPAHFIQQITAKANGEVVWKLSGVLLSRKTLPCFPV